MISSCLISKNETFKSGFIRLLIGISNFTFTLVSVVVVIAVVLGGESSMTNDDDDKGIVRGGVKSGVVWWGLGTETLENACIFGADLVVVIGFDLIGVVGLLRNKKNFFN